MDIDRENRVSFWEFNRVFTLTTSTKPNNIGLSGTISQIKTEDKTTENYLYKNSPQKQNKTTYLSPVKERTLLNQSLTKSGNRSIETGNSSNSENNLNQSYIRSKFSSYEDELFVEYLREVLINEREIERLKVLLSMRGDFNLRDLYKIFQFNNFSYLNSSDIKLGFNLFNVFPSNEEIDLLIKRYDGNNILSNTGFNEMLLPVDLEYNNLMKSRVGYEYHLKYTPEIFSFETRFCIENLFKALINTEISSETWRQKFYCLKTFDVRMIFDKIDIYSKNYIVSEDVSLLIY